MTFAASGILSGCPDIHTSIYDMEEQLLDGTAELRKTIPPELLRRNGIGAVKPRKSKTEGRTYLSNGCVQCEALQGRFFEHELAFDAFETEAEFKAEWMASLAGAKHYVQRWWFDES